MSKPVKSAVKWVQNQSLKKRGSSTSLPSSGGAAQYNASWAHPPEALLYGRVDYTVRYLGHAEVDQPKGTEVIKDAIRKIKFQLQVKRSQGHKISRVELQINIDGVNIIDPSTRMVIFRYPLHRISFCADDKQDKRVFSFIAKHEGNRHRCFVFLSDKLAEEITQTIGEAFDLAYRRFREKSGRDIDSKKQVVMLKKRVQQLEEENSKLKSALATYQRHLSNVDHNSMTDLEKQLVALQLESASPRQDWQVFKEDEPPVPTSPAPPKPDMPPPPNIKLPPVPGASGNRDLVSLASNGPEVGRKLENLQLDAMDDIFDPDFDPRAGEARFDGTTDMFGLAPFSNGPTNGVASTSAIGSEPGPGSSLVKAEAEGSKEELLDMLSHLNTRLAEEREMQEGFSQGLGMGTTENVEVGDFDPLGSLNGPSNGPMS